MARNHKAGGQGEPHTARMGELLPVGTVSKARRALDSYTAMRLRLWLQFKHKTRRRKGGTYDASICVRFAPSERTLSDRPAASENCHDAMT